MLLAIDIGNTNIVLGVFSEDKIIGTWRISTGVHRTSDEYGNTLVNMLAHKNIKVSQITDTVLCSVVPPLITVFEEASHHYFNIHTLVIEAGVKTGIKICMDNPREVGADRIVNAVAAHYLYGAPVIVIDLGTATTFDAVSAEGDYLGGAIAPGIAIATEALFNRTAVLPRVDLTFPKKAIGTNTVAAMQSGIIYGYAGLIESIVKRIQQEMGGKVKVVATGGFSELLAQVTPVIEEVNQEITLIGLKYIYEMNQTKESKKGNVKR